MNKSKQFSQPGEVWAWLQELAAPAKLILHVQLVAEAADALLLGYRQLPLVIDETLVQLGVALHDAGKNPLSCRTQRCRTSA